MIKKRIALLVGTFVVLMSAFLVYYYATESEQKPPTRSEEGVLPAGDGGTKINRDTTMDNPVTRTTVRRYDKNHRLREVYKWERAEQVADGLYELTAPSMEWRQSNGERLIIDAKKGLVHADRVGEEWHIRDGELFDDVRIDYDRRVGIIDRPRKERPEDTIRIRTERIAFDRENLTIRTQDRVNVFAREGDILGRGLWLSWDESPQELRELRILHGEYMCIRQGQASFMRKMTLPGGSGATTPRGAKPAKPAKPWTLRGADELLLVFEFQDPRKEKRSIPAGSAVRSGQPAAQTPTTPEGSQTQVPPAETKTQSTEPKVVAPGAPPPAVKDTYSAQFFGNVVVTSGFTTATGPAEEGEPAAPLIVTWTGPLVIKPVRYPAKYVPGRFDVSARGERLILTDGQAQVRCRSLFYDSLAQQARLIGSPGRPVEMEMPDGEQLVAPRVELDRKTGAIELVGPGRMRMPGRDSAILGTVGEPGGGRGEVTVQWTDRVDAMIGRQELPDGGRDYLREATFVGGVKVRQGPGRGLQADTLTINFRPPLSASDPINEISGLKAVGNVELADAQTGEYIRSDKLDVTMAPDGQGGVYPRKAVASGNVSARQEDAEMTGQEATVTFDERRKDETESDLMVRTFTLTGRPARVTQQDSVLEGPEIYFDQSRQEAAVTGAGRLAFLADKDLSGNRTAKPRPVEISWTERLNYHGRERIADFVGDVRLGTAGDSIVAKRMRVMFAPAPATATRPAAKSSRRLLRRQQNIKMVIAEKDVILTSTRLDDDGFILRRMELRSDQMIYEANPAGQERRSSLNCIGPGTLSVEDYGKPEVKTGRTGGRAGQPFGGTVARPSQSAFRWTRSMSLDWSRPRKGAPAREGTLVRMAGDVQMSHRSGKQLVLLDGLKVRQWADVPKGRRTTLTCDRMLAEFGPPQEKPADELAADNPADQTGPRVGSLKLFDAYGDVDLRDGLNQVVCQQLLYQQDKDVALIYGSLPNQPPKNAIIYRQDTARRRLAPFSARKLIWYRATNRVEALDVEGSISR